MASARKFSSWCAPRARCTRSRIAPGVQKHPFSMASIAMIRSTTPRGPISSCCARSVAPPRCAWSSTSSPAPSAGGINGTMLARALSHDLPMGALRNLWLDNADVAVLLAPDARARTWSKWFLKPFLWAVARTASFRAITDMEVRQKLSLFVRSRWFKPPLDGRVMAGLMYDAVMSMGAPKSPRASLLPSGQSLDLFVTLTDYYGYQQLVQRSE